MEMVPGIMAMANCCCCWVMTVAQFNLDHFQPVFLVFWCHELTAMTAPLSGSKIDVALIPMPQCALHH
eukprot:13089774-Ditylum_brightwellii.AAC.1